MTWSSPLNAEIYDEFVRERELYQFLNRELIQRADLAAARRVLDLACGTGATSRSCLAVIPADGEIVGVDGSAAMVEVARATIRDPRVRFEVGQATGLVDVLAPSFDRVVCNAAFWQFPSLDRVFADLARLVADGAKLIFNVPAERIVGQTLATHALQAALARLLVAATGVPMPAPTQLIDPAQLDATAASHGFTLAGWDDVSYACAQGELLELMEIPALLGPLTTGLGDAAIEQLLSDARAAVDLEERVEVRWRYFVYDRSRRA